MSLREFDVLGEEISDEKTEEIVKQGDPRRSLVRYRPDGSELFVSARINLPLLRAAVSLPVLLLKPASREDEVLKPNDPTLEAAGGWDLLTPEGSRRNWGLLERICEDLTKQSVPACYLAEQHGANRRDFYFVTEDVAGLERIARAAAEALSFPLGDRGTPASRGRAGHSSDGGARRARPRGLGRRPRPPDPVRILGRRNLVDEAPGRAREARLPVRRI